MIVNLGDMLSTFLQKDEWVDDQLRHPRDKEKLLLSEKYFDNHESILARRVRQFHSLISYLLRRARLSKRPLGPPDWVTTPHDKSWALREPFRSAYNTAVCNVGEDYRIPWRIQTLIWAASIAINLRGDFVELGTGRGFSMIAVRESVKVGFGKHKVIYCFDVFQKPDASGLGESRFASKYVNDVQTVRDAFGTVDEVRFIEGDVRETLLCEGPEEISLLHIDLNDPSTESWALRLLWAKVVPGAVIVLDDFANRGMEETNRIMYRTLQDLGCEVLSLPSGQGLAVKPGCHETFH